MMRKKRYAQLQVNYLKDTRDDVSMKNNREYHPETIEIFFLEVISIGAEALQKLQEKSLKKLEEIHE